MKTFDLKSGTIVMVDENQIVIERSGGKSARKGCLREGLWAK
jgi:hypothetical protein